MLASSSTYRGLWALHMSTEYLFGYLSLSLCESKQFFFRCRIIHSVVVFLLFFIIPKRRKWTPWKCEWHPINFSFSLYRFFLFCCCWERNLSSVVVIFHEVTESVTRDGVGPTENIKNLFIFRFDFVKFSFTQMLHHCLCYHITYLYVVLRFKPFKFDYLTLCLTSMIW